jgi:molecular chaperone DnaK
MTPLIESNSTIPTSKSQVFSTAADNQSSVEIHVLQGERAQAAANRTLGRFHLDGIPPAPRGMPQIEVTFDLDANGVLNIMAKDKGTGKEQSIRIESSSGLSDEEIEKMKQAAKDHEEEDKKIREKVEKMNQADGLIFSTKKQLDEYGDKISEDNKKAIEDAVAKLEEVHKAENLEEMDAAMEAVNTAWAGASQEIYAASQAEAEAAGAQGAEGAANGDTQGASDSEDNDAVDADFEVVDEDDKDK